jgi:hypothetical protein
MRKILGVVAVAGLAVALAAGPAFAHECYNASRSVKGNTAIAAHSPSFFTFDDAAMGFFTDPFVPDGSGGLGLCTEGAQWLLDQIHANADAVGFDASIVISGRVVQASGIDHSPSARAQANLANGKGIDHLGENAALNEFIMANFEQAMEQCPV